MEKLEHVASLGFSCIELMPVTEFGGAWGYNPRSCMAIHVRFRAEQPGCGPCCRLRPRALWFPSSDSRCSFATPFVSFGGASRGMPGDAGVWVPRLHVAQSDGCTIDCGTQPGFSLDGAVECRRYVPCYAT
jgi:hypothetical protein